MSYRIISLIRSPPTTWNASAPSTRASTDAASGSPAWMQWQS